MTLSEFILKSTWLHHQKSCDMDNPTNWTTNKLKTERGPSYLQFQKQQLNNHLSKPDSGSLKTDASGAHTFQAQTITITELPGVIIAFIHFIYFSRGLDY